MTQSLPSKVNLTFQRQLSLSNRVSKLTMEVIESVEYEGGQFLCFFDSLLIFERTFSQLVMHLSLIP